MAARKHPLLVMSFCGREAKLMIIVYHETLGSDAGNSETCILFLLHCFPPPLLGFSLSSMVVNCAAFFPANSPKL